MNKESSTKDLGLSSNERLAIINKSIFAPKRYQNLIPKGFNIYTFHAGFKKKLDDLLIIIFDKIVTTSVVYSKTSTPSAPIIWDKKNNKGSVKALIINSGNANAHTGKEGINIIDKYVDFLISNIGCKKSEILVSSTGVIGETLDPALIIRKISDINKNLTGNLLNAAKAIMTTDTYPKTSIKRVKLNHNSFKIYGIAKGSGMIYPNMGTMLVYIFIEAKLSKNVLNKLVKFNLERTFNSISTDGDTSTSDTLALFSLNKFDLSIISKKDFQIVNKALFDVMHDLALQVVKDGEGLSKLIKVNVKRCKSNKQAKNIGFSILNSPLVKTAIAGEDPNWGRIIAAIGKSKEKIDQEKIKIFFGKYLVCKDGKIYKDISTKKIDRYIKKQVIEISVDVNNGNFDHTVFGNDLTHEYIRINAEYRT
tara:strand:- start:12777 stop:14042 length:1266 start_codon:yes stop_codon:yes gene_type:complete